MCDFEYTKIQNTQMHYFAKCIMETPQNELLFHNQRKISQYLKVNRYWQTVTFFLASEKSTEPYLHVK